MMLTIYHTEICQRALSKSFTPAALEVLIAANVAQDDLRGQIGHPEYHFDDSAFEAGYAYIAAQRNLIQEALKREDKETAWQAFGRLTHAAQDFYAHSNYLALWLARFPKDSPPAPQDVDPLAPEILQHPELRSGQVYYLEVLAYLPALRPLTRKLLPAHAHANMNLDYPERGALFPYAIEAAVKRTRHELQQTLVLLDSEARARFRGS